MCTYVYSARARSVQDGTSLCSSGCTCVCLCACNAWQRACVTCSTSGRAHCCKRIGVSTHSATCACAWCTCAHKGACTVLRGELPSLPVCSAVHVSAFTHLCGSSPSVHLTPRSCSQMLSPVAGSGSWASASVPVGPNEHYLPPSPCPGLGADIEGASPHLPCSQAAAFRVWVFFPAVGGSVGARSHSCGTAGLAVPGTVVSSCRGL